MTAPFVHVTAVDTVHEVLSQYPATAPVFHLLGLDTSRRAGARPSLPLHPKGSA
jgi:hypothetical protein